MAIYAYLKHFFLEMLETKMLINGRVVLKKLKHVKLLTDDGKRTSHDDGQRPITIGHLSDSFEL